MNSKPGPSNFFRCDMLGQWSLSLPRHKQRDRKALDVEISQAWVHQFINWESLEKSSLTTLHFLQCFPKDWMYLMEPLEASLILRKCLADADLLVYKAGTCKQLKVTAFLSVRTAVTICDLQGQALRLL